MMSSSQDDEEGKEEEEEWTEEDEDDDTSISSETSLSCRGAGRTGDWSNDESSFDEQGTTSRAEGDESTQEEDSSSDEMTQDGEMEEEKEGSSKDGDKLGKCTPEERREACIMVAVLIVDEIVQNGVSYRSKKEARKQRCNVPQYDFDQMLRESLIKEKIEQTMKLAIEVSRSVVDQVVSTFDQLFTNKPKAEEDKSCTTMVVSLQGWNRELSQEELEKRTRALQLIKKVSRDRKKLQLARKQRYKLLKDAILEEKEDRRKKEEEKFKCLRERNRELCLLRKKATEEERQARKQFLAKTTTRAPSSLSTMPSIKHTHLRKRIREELRLTRSQHSQLLEQARERLSMRLKFRAPPPCDSTKKAKNFVGVSRQVQGKGESQGDDQCQAQHNASQMMIVGPPTERPELGQSESPRTKRIIAGLLPDERPERMQKVSQELLASVKERLKRLEELKKKLLTV